METRTEDECNTLYVGKWGRIPYYMRGGLVRWIYFHIEPGDFLEEVICNDLAGACHVADDTNRHLLFDYVSFLYCHAPSPCWGSKEKYREVGRIAARKQKGQKC